MTTWTTEDRQNSSPPHIVDTGASYEPMPFAGLVAIQDQEDTEQMLRDQLRIVKAECNRLQSLLRKNGIQY